MVEFDRQKKVISMMMTSHSILRDRYLRLSSLFENGLLVASAILNSFVFIDENFINRLTNLGSDGQKAIIGITSIIVFAISIVLLQVKWKEKASLHDKAADSLLELLHSHREIESMNEGVEKNASIETFSTKYSQVTGSIVKIPDRSFNSLKLRHKRKVELSKLIDRYPNSTLLFLRIKQLFSSFKERE